MMCIITAHNIHVLKGFLFVFMAQLHLTWASYDLFVYDFRYDFQASQVGLNYDVCVHILFDHHVISLGDKPGQHLQRPCGDRTETAQSSRSDRIIFTTT